MPGRTWRPTTFEAELLERGIGLINSRPYHLETNGKLERLHGSIEKEIQHYESLSAYVGYYNECRLHFALDIDRCGTSMQAFSAREASESIRKSDPKWMEGDINGNSSGFRSDLQFQAQILFDRPSLMAKFVPELPEPELLLFLSYSA